MKHASGLWRWSQLQFASLIVGWAVLQLHPPLQRNLMDSTIHRSHLMIWDCVCKTKAHLGTVWCHCQKSNFSPALVVYKATYKRLTGRRNTSGFFQLILRRCFSSTAQHLYPENLKERTQTRKAQMFPVMKMGMCFKNLYLQVTRSYLWKHVGTLHLRRIFWLHTEVSIALSRALPSKKFMILIWFRCSLAHYLWDLSFILHI